MSEIKKAFRSKARQARNETEKITEKSATIWRSVLTHEKFTEAESILAYLNIRSEVETQSYVKALVEKRDKKVFVPYCDDDQLQIFHLTSWDQLETGAFGVLEPRNDLRNDQVVPPQTVEVVLVPGLAFDIGLNRMGYGRGFYDCLLPRLPDAFRMGLAFESQIFARIPTGENDSPMNCIVTEERIIQSSVTGQ